MLSSGYYGDDVPESIDTDELITAARRAIGRSYAPYSDFKSAAVVRAEDGTDVAGVIVENVSLGLAMCAERVAMFAAVAQGHRPVALALAAPSTATRQTWPCGACLQVALELGGKETLIIVGDDDDGPVETATVGELLPNGPKIKLKS